MSALSYDQIVERGEERAGISVDADAAWRPALHLLVTSAHDEGGLTATGAAQLGDKLAELVADRLVAEEELARDPAIHARPLPVRFVVAGLARSGTTFLHRLLACDPDVEFLPTWQAFRPVPPRSGDDERRAAVLALVENLRATNPESFRIHPLDADAPEEEVFLLQLSFASMLFALTCPLPSYNEWLSTTDHRQAYEFAFDLIRLNEHSTGRPPGRPRVMKSPQFVLDLQVATELLPDAVFIQNHRDPVDLVGSYCSTYTSSRRRTCAGIDPIALGRERLDHLAAMAHRALPVRQAADAGSGTRFVDVRYARLVAEPLAVIEELYDVAGLQLTAPTTRAVEHWLAAHPQNAAGSHDYNLAEYGLSRRDVETALADYIERFDPGAKA
jgi:hypothetical protein